MLFVKHLTKWLVLTGKGGKRMPNDGLEELYVAMRELRDQYYASLNETLKIDIALFFQIVQVGLRHADDPADRGQ